MRTIAKAGREDLAMVYIAEMDDKKIEFVESIQPPLTREEKWVLIVSTMYGCPVNCRFCDAGGCYKGKLSEEEILFQIDYLVRKRFPDGSIPVKKFKIQFARMGEPSLNQNVLGVLDKLPEIYDAPGLIPSLSTVAPRGTDGFFERLLEIKERYSNFQLQFSIHTTDENLRDWLIPVKKWSFEEMAEYGSTFYTGGRKITLNFALADGMPIDPDMLLGHFNPDIFLVKITPVNPTYNAARNGISPLDIHDDVVGSLRNAGYETILSIGEMEENQIGSNCGQYVMTHRKAKKSIDGGYTYDLKEIED